MYPNLNYMLPSHSNRSSAMKKNGMNDYSNEIPYHPYQMPFGYGFMPNSPYPNPSIFNSGVGVSKQMGNNGAAKVEFESEIESLDMMTQEIHRIKEKLKKSQTSSNQYDFLKKKITELDSAVNETIRLKKENEQLLNTNSLLNQQLEEFQGEVMNLTNENQALIGQLQNSYQKSIEKEDNDQVSSLVEALQQELDNAMTLLKQKSEENEHLMDENNHLSKGLNTINNELNSLQQKLPEFDSLRIENENLRSALTDSHEKLAHELRQKDNLEKEVCNLQKKLQDTMCEYEQKFSEVLADNERLTEQITLQNKESQKSVHSESINPLSSSSSDRKEENSKMHQDLSPETKTQTQPTQQESSTKKKEEEEEDEEYEMRTSHSKWVAKETKTEESKPESSSKKGKRNKKKGKGKKAKGKVSSEEEK